MVKVHFCAVDLSKELNLSDPQVHLYNEHRKKNPYLRVVLRTERGEA